jgi:hypothetical protein
MQTSPGISVYKRKRNKNNLLHYKLILSFVLYHLNKKSRFCRDHSINKRTIPLVISKVKIKENDIYQSGFHYGTKL